MKFQGISNLAISSLNFEAIRFSLAQTEDRPGWPIKKIILIEKWYRRFLFLIYKYPDKTIVPTKDIDMFWHYHILDTHKYISDCQAVFGEYLHHFPYFGARGKEDRRNLSKAFKETERLFRLHFNESPLNLEMAELSKKNVAALCGKCSSGCKNSKQGKYGLAIKSDFRPTLTNSKSVAH